MEYNLDKMTIEEYQNYILEIITRLYSNNSLNLVQRASEDGKLILALEFSPPEWFSKLSKDVQNIAFVNLQEIMMAKIKNLPKDYLEN